MSDIAPISPVSATRPEGGGPVERDPARRGADARPPRPSDRVELSDRARYLSKLAELPAMRSDLVEAVRSEIERGTYDSTERLDEAIRALAEDLGLDG